MESYPKFYGRNMKTGEILSSDEDGKHIYLKVTKDLTEHYFVKTQSGRLSTLLSDLRSSYGKPKFTKINETVFNMFKRFVDTGNTRYLTQAERMM